LLSVLEKLLDQRRPNTVEKLLAAVEMIVDDPLGDVSLVGDFLNTGIVLPFGLNFIEGHINDLLATGFFDERFAGPNF
jgi:hypothetical protein